MTYTLIDRNGALIERGLSAVDAMHLMLTDDGYAYEIRPEADGVGFRLWCSDGSAASMRGAGHFVKTVAFSLECDLDAATQEIAERVISAGWRRMPQALTDSDYDAMMDEAVDG